MAVDSIIGPLPHSWTVISLGDICRSGGGDVQTGPFGSQLHASDYVPVGIPSIMPKDIQDDRVNTNDIARISLQDAERLIKYRVRVGDLVYSRRGDVRRRALIREKEDGWLCGTGCLRVRFGDSKVDPQYAYYYFGHVAVQEWIVQRAVGATMQNLNSSILAEVPFALPPLPEQQGIAHILGTLDDKIELNRRMNETLEAIARAVFKSWFVDFEPIPGIGPHEGWEETEFGKIPRGWQPLTWGDVITLEYGKSLKGKHTEGGEYPVYGTNGRIGGWSTRLCEHPGIIIGRKGAYRGVHFSDEPFFVIDTAFYMEPKSEVEMRWAFYEASKLDLNSMDSGSAIPSTSRDDFYALPVVIPPFNIQKRFVELLTPFWTKQRHNEEESRTLASIRDALLPKLLSGQIRVPNLKQFIQESVL